MCFTMIPAAAFADEGDTDDEKRLVVFGASTANGYGHVDYVNADETVIIMIHYKAALSIWT